MCYLYVWVYMQLRYWSGCKFQNILSMCYPKEYKPKHSLLIYGISTIIHSMSPNEFDDIENSKAMIKTSARNNAMECGLLQR